jgi:hypothetical protein
MKLKASRRQSVLQVESQFDLEHRPVTIPAYRGGSESEAGLKGRSIESDPGRIPAG